MAPFYNDPFRTAAILMHQFGFSLEDAFLGPWYLRYNTAPPFSFYTVLARVRHFNVAHLPELSIKQMEAAVSARNLGPNPWYLHKNDPTYCRVCYREPIYRRLRCKYCVRQLRLIERAQKPQPILCRVPDCGQPHCASGRCRRHYMQAYRWNTLWRPPEEHNLPIDWSTIVIPVPGPKAEP